jgi:hydrogenase nickel incorporation protein HypB
MEIKVLKDILSANDQIAESNRGLLKGRGRAVYTINVMSSPGSGKTSLILETIRSLKEKVRIAVIEGDISSTIDAQKVSQEDVPVLQINTGGECHLDASMVNRALGSLPLEEIDLLLIENVGNLVCPGEFRLGEDLKLLILSVPEGDDKVHKYPLLFSLADAVIINKIDLLPYSRFDLEGFTKAFHGMNQKARIFQVSCTTREGIDEWASWVLSKMGPRVPG